MAAAAAMFAACSETDMVNVVNEAETQNAIGFDEFVGKSTRGINTTNLNDYLMTPKTVGFGVWAYKGDAGNVATAVMENYNVAYDGGWVYSGKTGGTTGDVAQVLKYWDKLKAYEFYAYAPYNMAVTIDAKDIQIAEGEYAANENLVGTTLLEATDDNTDALNTKKYSGVGATSTTETTDWMIATIPARTAGATDLVEAPFVHTMSRLIVNLKSTTDATLTINSVYVNNVLGKGYFQDGAWVVNAANKKNIAGATGKLVGSSTSSSVYYCMEYLVLPSTTAPTFSINYTLNGDTKEVNDVAITSVDEFVAATTYEVTVTIGNDPIAFTAEVKPWDTPKSGSVSIN